MLFHGSTIDKNIIEEHHEKFPKERTEHVIHNTLECSRSICKAKGHDLKLAMAMMSLEGSLVFIMRQHSHLVITRSHVHLCKEF
jgi:hypothetical protein